MKNLILFLLLLILIVPSLAITFKDLPSNHWASDAVYDLVNQGIISGYSDGTFKGTKTINRYEVSLYLHKILKIIDKKMANLSARSFSDTKIKQLESQIQELKQEIKQLKNQIKKDNL